MLSYIEPELCGTQLEEWPPYCQSIERLLTPRCDCDDAVLRLCQQPSGLVDVCGLSNKQQPDRPRGMGSLQSLGKWTKVSAGKMQQSDPL